MDHFAHLPMFVQVIENGSFSKAARVAGISKSAVSKRISDLEKLLGTQLIQRTTRQLSLTEAGQRYYYYARQAVEQAKNGADAISELNQKPKGTLRISVPMAFGRLHLSPLFGEFINLYPDLELDIHLSDSLTDLVQDQFDIAIRIGQLQDSAMIARLLAPCYSVVCATPQYLEQRGTPLQPDDLKHHNCLFYSYFQAGAEWQFHHNGKHHRFKPKGNYRVNNSEVILDALLQNTGVCQLPTFIAGDAIRSGQLIPLLTDYRLPEHGIYAVYPRRKYLPAKVSVFLQFLHTKIPSLQQQWDRNIVA